MTETFDISKVETALNKSSAHCFVYASLPISQTRLRASYKQEFCVFCFDTPQHFKKKNMYMEMHNDNKVIGKNEVYYMVRKNGHWKRNNFATFLKIFQNTLSLFCTKPIS